MRHDAWALPLVLAFVVAVHSLPHLPGADPPTSPLDAFVKLGQRATGAFQGHDDPYPIHVDEHYHMAQAAQIDRQGTLQYDAPYTGAPQHTDLFSIGGLRSERGFEVLVAQLHQLTGASFPLLFRFLPALWAGVLAATVWAALRPAPGALASAAFVAILPTTVHFLGVGFLVPSAFALAWIPAVIVATMHARGPSRMAATTLLITGAFLLHLSLGVVVLATAVLCAALQPGSRMDRLAAVATALLPLLWILPPLYQDAVAAVSSPNGLPFEASVFRTPGIAIFTLAAIGAFGAWYRRTAATVPHRVASVLLVLLAASMAGSIRLGHHNDGTYTRLVHAFFLTVAILAGLGAASLVGFFAQRWARGEGGRAAAWLKGGAVVVLAAAALAQPVAAHMKDPYYRVFDGQAWAAAGAFAASGAGPNDVFLGHPWQAPVLNALTGAKPWTVLYPGSPPVHGDDWDSYLSTSGASSSWLKQRGITYVVSPIPPNAPHQDLAPGVFRIR